MAALEIRQFIAPVVAEIAAAAVCMSIYVGTKMGDFRIDAARSESHTAVSRTEKPAVRKAVSVPSVATPKRAVARAGQLTEGQGKAKELLRSIMKVIDFDKLDLDKNGARCAPLHVGNHRLARSDHKLCTGVININEFQFAMEDKLGQRLQAVGVFQAQCSTTPAFQMNPNCKCNSARPSACARALIKRAESWHVFLAAPNPRFVFPH